MKTPCAPCVIKLDKKLKKGVDTKTDMDYGIGMIKLGTSKNKETKMKSMGEIASLVEKRMLMGMDFIESVKSVLENPTEIDYGIIKHILYVERNVQ